MRASKLFSVSKIQLRWSINDVTPAASAAGEQPATMRLIYAVISKSAAVIRASVFITWALAVKLTRAMICWTTSPARSTSELAAFATLLADICNRIVAAAIPDAVMELTVLMPCGVSPDH